MTKSRPIARWGFLRGGLLPLGLLTVVAVGSPSQANGIPLGKFQFYPSVSMRVAEDDNLFDQSDAVAAGRVSDRSADLEAALVLQLPFRASLWELAYTPSLRRYQDNDDLDGDTHRLSTELDLIFSTGSSLNLQGIYTRDYSNLQQAADQLSESEFNFIDYEIIRARAEYQQPFGQRHGMEAILDFESLRFDDSGLDVFTDSSELQMTLSYVRLLGRDMRMFVGAMGGSNDLDQPSRIAPECHRDPAECSPDSLIFREQEREDHWTRVGVQVGLERQFDDKNRARLDLGYQVLEFDHSNDSDFSGLVVRLRYSRRFSDAVSVSGELARQAVQSSFDVNNHFVMQRATATVQLQPGGTSLYYFGALSFQTNAYPEETQLSVNAEFDGTRECLGDAGVVVVSGVECVGDGFRRRDKIGSLELGMGMQFSALSSLDLTVSARRRGSNLTPAEREFFEEPLTGIQRVRVIDRSLNRLDYDDLVIGLTFRYGFIPQRNYI